MQPDSKATKKIGTPLYMSPDVINEFDGYDTKVDIWALGVIATELVSGDLPFNADSKEELFHEIVYEEPNLDSIPDTLTQGGELARNFILKCLEKNPEQRPDAS